MLTLLGVGDQAGALPNWQALVLGLVQGATELLPISSSGHLILVPWLGDWQYLKEHDAFNQTFDVALHLGTLVAVVGYFWRDIVRARRPRGFERCARAGSRPARSGSPGSSSWRRSLPRRSASLGEDVIASNLGEPWQIAIAARRRRARPLVRRPAAGAAGRWADLGLKAAVGMGLAQSLALMPGVSRSGITISAGRLLQLDRDSAARFSFLLLVPTVLGAVLLKGVKDVLLGDLPAGLDRPVRRRHARGGRKRPDRHLRRSSATCAGTTTRSSSGYRLIVAAIVAAADRDGRPVGRLLSGERAEQPNLCQLDITLILVH